jgi:Cu-processing system ATP-binding protein
VADPLPRPVDRVVDLAHVCKRYGAKTVVRDVSLSIGAGECLALLGHNGAGKTTLIKLMLGLTRASGGTVSVLGQDPAARQSVELRRSVGYLPENVSFHDAMTGREVLTFYARLKREPVERCAALLQQVGLADAADRRVRTYSKGMRQRLGLAQALLGEPRLLFLDEPTTGLDPSLRLDFFRILAALRSDGVAVLISTHALSEIESRIDRVAILREGSLVAAGSLDELRRRSALPIRVRLRVDPGRASALAHDLGSERSFERINDCTVDLTCLDGEKMALVRHIGSLATPVRDVEIRMPGLEDIYAHFAIDGGPK